MDDYWHDNSIQYCASVLQHGLVNESDLFKYQMIIKWTIQNVCQKKNVC